MLSKLEINKKLWEILKYSLTLNLYIYITTFHKIDNILTINLLNHLNLYLNNTCVHKIYEYHFKSLIKLNLITTIPCQIELLNICLLKPISFIKHFFY